MNASPNGLHHVEQVPEGEIRFGPVYFRLRIDGRDVPNRIFGSPLVWSDDSTLLAAQEWLTTEDGIGPETRAVLINIDSWSIACLKVVEKGYACDFRFAGSQFIYRKKYPGLGNEFEAELELSAIHNWSGI